MNQDDDTLHHSSDNSHDFAQEDVHPPSDRYVEKRRGGVDRSMDRGHAVDPDRIGDALRRARLSRRESIGDIADYLRIRPEFLASLESCRYEDLPADAYVIGFLRTYAVYLGIDGKNAIDRYRREMAGRRRKPQLSMPQPVSEGRAPTLAIIVGGLVAALLIYALWYIFATSDRAEVSAPPPLPQMSAKAEPNPIESTISVPQGSATPTVLPSVAPSTLASPAALPSVAPSVMPSASPSVAPSVTPSAQPSALPSSIPSVAASAVAAPAPSPTALAEETKAQVYGDTSGSSRVLLLAKRDCWIMVTDAQGTTIFDRTLKAGESYAVPNTKGARLTTGNARGMIVRVDGVDLPPLSNDGRVVRAVSLDPENLKNRKTPPSLNRVEAMPNSVTNPSAIPSIMLDE